MEEIALLFVGFGRRILVGGDEGRDKKEEGNEKEREESKNSAKNLWPLPTD